MAFCVHNSVSHAAIYLYAFILTPAFPLIMKTFICFALRKKIALLCVEGVFVAVVACFMDEYF